ncbi:MAG: L-aspartate oxidase [Chloroflexota bacterium]
MQTDVLIIGSGISGVIAALRLAEDKQRQITIITRAVEEIDANSSYAQGGIVGRGIDDSPELLAEDIFRAGAGLCHPPAVEQLADLGPGLLEEILINQAHTPFDRGEDNQLAMGLEGAHSRSRILHVQDSTGRAIMEALLEKIKAYPNIKLLTGHTAIDLITFPHHATDPLRVYQQPVCLGTYAFNQEEQNVIPIIAEHTILATGGLGQIFLNTTNPVGSRGDGLAMAYRAGARIINSEYVQFHPTALNIPGATKFLISEAVRGEGAVLLTPGGERFMERYAPEWKELAPRDVVARAIYWEMLTNDYNNVFLDIASHKPPDHIRKRFPQIYQRCLEEGVDITVQPIPVVPAAHYFIGGLHVDLNGQTSIPGLYAVGEVSCTGVHGANRLASTSLLEGVVWGSKAADHIQSQPEPIEYSAKDIPEWSTHGLRHDPDPALIQSDMTTIRSLMWHYVGLIRSEYRLTRAIRDLRTLYWEIENFYRKTRISDQLIGLRNSSQAALIIAYAAAKNRTSRGCHYREDDRSNA